jgi:hypothetical protein
MGEARWEHLESVVWVPELVDDVASDLSAFHRVDDPMRLSSARYFTLARRLVHYAGAVRFELSQRVQAAPAPERQAETTPVVHSLDDARAIRDAIRRRRYPAEKWGEMRKVSVAEINATASRALTGG